MDGDDEGVSDIEWLASDEGEAWADEIEADEDRRSDGPREWTAAGLAERMVARLMRRDDRRRRGK